MSAQIWTEAQAKQYLKLPAKSDHKYSRGVVAFLTGSKKFPGAALLSTEAALSTGVGMVRYLGAKSVAKLVLLNTPEVVISSGRTDAYVMGSGIPETSPLWTKRKLGKILNLNMPTVLDAGSLYLTPKAHPMTVITPHYGELAKLLSASQIKVDISEIATNPSYWAFFTAKKFNLTVLLKGNTTYLANPKRVLELPSAPPQLASAGTGDVLAGVLGGLLAINHEILTVQNLIEIAATSCLIHTNAAKFALEVSQTSVLRVNDLITQIPIQIEALLSL